MKRSFNEFKQYIKGKNTAVLGIGISNKPLIDFLMKLGAKVTAFDKKDRQSLGEIVGELEEKGVKLVLGENYLGNLKGYEVIFKTPSMRIDLPALVEAKNEGSYITSEMEEFVKYCPAKIFGITGSDGKTTTTSIVYAMLKAQGYTAYVGGNIGTPLFSKIESMKPEDKVVLELSSFQLMTMDVSPDVSAVTNMSPNHLNVHKDMQEYIDAKKNVFRFQDKSGILVLNDDNDITRAMESEANGQVLKFSTKKMFKDGAYYKDGFLYYKGEPVCRKDELNLKGMHNVENMLTAYLVVGSDVSIETMTRVSKSFMPVEHRAEFVRELNGVTYINDSIATSPTRVLAGLKAFDKPVILIAGGYDKNIPFDKLAEDGISRIKLLILMGNTKKKIYDAFKKVMNERKINLPIITVDELEDAVLEAKKAATSGDIINFSPACASFDKYPNFAVRGEKYKEIVNKLK